jgi:hypothetical protein
VIKIYIDLEVISLGELFVEILCELVYHWRPCAIILELSEVTFALLNELEKHVPCIFLNYLLIFFLVL